MRLYFGLSTDLILTSSAKHLRRGLRAATVADGKLVALVGREEFVDLTEPVGKGLRCQKWIFTLTQVLIVEVETEREQIDSECVGEGCFQVGVPCLLIDTF